MPTGLRPKVFELTNYPLERLGYIGTGSSLRAIDPETLTPLTKHGLRLGGYSNGLVLAHDRREAAFGSIGGGRRRCTLRSPGPRAAKRSGADPDPVRVAQVSPWPTGETVVPPATVVRGHEVVPRAALEHVVAGAPFQEVLAGVA